MTHSLPARGVLALSTVVSALCTAGLAQVPYGHVVVAETTPRSNHSGLLFLDPDTGIFTRTRFRTGGGHYGSHHMVALDPTDPRTIFSYAGYDIRGTPIQEFKMEGNRIVGLGGATGPVVETKPVRMHISPTLPETLLFTSRGKAPGLYARPTTFGADRQL
ncbi:MAG: hypothetical protein ACYST0_10625, partial [Planctomycetota bacterium]